MFRAMAGGGGGLVAEATALLEVHDVTKSFGAVAAVQGGSFPLYGGEAHALVGENGAGKSTIGKMLAGVHRPDTRPLRVRGADVDFAGPADAKAAGIAVIYQEPTLFPDLSVAENIAMGNQPLTRLRQIDRKAMHATADRLFARLGVHIDPTRPARGLSIADQQLVEIAKALNLPAAENPEEDPKAGEARVLIMDEPTAALSGVEVDRLFAVVRSLRDEGAAIMFISHRFEEITALCERVTIMRDGRHVCTEPVADLTIDDMIRRMVGRDLSAMFPKEEVEP